jgi:hypothetical protein
MKKLIIPIVVLVIAVGALIFLGGENSDIIVDTKEGQVVVTREDILLMESSTTFPTVVRSSGSKPVETDYTGIWIMDFLENLNIGEEEVDTIIFNASDGYRIILSIEELKEPSNVFLTYMRDGEDLKSRSKGGNGPYQLVIRDDPFSQRWIKHVDEIIIQ